MNLMVRPQSPLGIKEQIKRQLRSLIARGEFKPGQALPPARDLAATLGVNRNTAWAAYRELAAEGLLTASRGSGTFVSKSRLSKDVSGLEKILKNLFRQAEELGFEPGEVCDQCLGFAAGLTVDLTRANLLVVECNQETGEHIAAELKRELGVKTRTVLIQTLEREPDRALEFLQGVNLVVCGFNHLAEFRAVVPRSPVDAVGVLMKADLRALNEMQNLPPGSRVGLTCANQRSTETLFKNLNLAGGSTLSKIWAGQDNPAGIREMLEKCQVIFATHVVYDRILELAGPGQTVHRVELSLDPGGIELVRERLTDILRKKADAQPRA